MLQQAGVGRGDRVGLFVERSCDVVVGMLAAMGLGAAYVPIDPMYPDSRVGALVAGADVRAVISQRALAGRLPTATVVVLVDAEPAGEVDASEIDLVAPTTRRTCSSPPARRVHPRASKSSTVTS